ncbi:MAG TPA: hypothetical protein PLV68_19075, partial [Ilumatobacteraceae bacterium]|nr:hypothetical protein [Ilumatobacteraceae bacterium]
AATSAEDNRVSTAEDGAAAVKQAQQAKALANAALADATKPRDTTTLEQTLADAKTALDQARADYAEADASIGTKVPSGEIVFIPVLPSTVTDVSAALGNPAND